MKGLLHIIKILGGLKALRWYKAWNDRVVVLCFHRINDKIDPFFPSLNPQVFKNLLKYAKQNFELISIDDLNKSKTKRPKLIITFDDGYKDFIEYAVPILDELKLPSIHAIVYKSAENGDPIWTQSVINILKTMLNSPAKNISIRAEIGDFQVKNQLKDISKLKDILFAQFFQMDSGKRNMIIQQLNEQFEVENTENEMMNWVEIKQCISAGVEIANHSLSHDTLSLDLTPDQLYREIVQSKALIETKINQPVNVFAFPNGLYSQSALELGKLHYDFLLKLDDRIENRRNLPLVSRMGIYHESLIENKFRTEGMYNLIKAPYRLLKRGKNLKTLS